MTFRTLIRRSLRFHWRSHLGVVLGAAIGSAALIGALVVGDSVKESLRETALLRLGEVHLAMTPTDRYFGDDFGRILHESFEGWSWLWDTNPYTHATIRHAPAVGLVASATISRRDGDARANRVSIYGFLKEDETRTKHYSTSPFRNLRQKSAIGGLKAGEVFINESLAVQLHAKAGDEIIVRIRRPTGLSGESPISSRREENVAFTLRVAGILEMKHWGDLNFHAVHAPPLNAFMELAQLQEVLKLEGRANLLLYGEAGFLKPALLTSSSYQWPEFMWDIAPGLFAKDVKVSDTKFAQRVNLYLSRAIRLEDLELSLSTTAKDGKLRLTSRRVFLDPPIGHATLATDTNAQSLLTYLATLLRSGTNATPYSMVTAAGAPWTPADLRDDEIIVSQWLADDLRVKQGDEIALSYFLPESGARLEEATNRFRVHSIVPMEMPWADRTLMPDFPGIEKAESTSEWDAGFPLTYEIRKKDDDYWKQYRGTPKAFITLAAGQKMWGNRFGNLTAIRFPIPTNATPALAPALSLKEREKRSPSLKQTGADISTNSSPVISSVETPSPLPGGEGQGEGERQINFSSPINHPPATSGTPPHVVAYKEALEKKILANLKPEELGLRFEPVLEQALKAAAESQDFGGLFLGFSFFLIIAALLLMAMLFQFGLEQRAAEIGTLLALGFTPKQVRKLLLREGVTLAFFGGVIGMVGGIYFAKAMLHGLTTIWRDAVGATALNFHVTGQTLVIGVFASVVVSTITIWLALRKFVKRSPRELLVGEIQVTESKVSSLKSKVIALAATILAFGLVGWTLAKGDTVNAGAFFGAGALVLIAGLSFVSAWLVKLAGALVSDPARSAGVKHAGPEAGAPFTMLALAVRGCARRRKRSLATVAMLACGSFLIVSIGVFRLDANRDATQRSSGTGGFALIGETTLPVVQDLNAASGRDFFALNEQDLNGVKIVPFRVRQGDEASCLNLNRAQKPKLLGVKPAALEGRFMFAKGSNWRTLISTRLQSGVPASSNEENRLSGFPAPPPANTGLKPGANEIEIPAIGDANSIQWAMGKKVGDTIEYVDERGQPFKVRIIGAVANSILQGQLIIDEAEFVKRFPGESGYRMFLIDAPSNAVSQVSATLSRAMQDVGLELTPTAVRLNQFNAVQNTYLGTFQVLGGLGLLLGSVGLGIVVLRNVLERRSELAVLLAVGFRRRQVQRLLLLENGALLLAGLAIGVVAAGVAVLPAVLSPAAQLPVASLGVTLAAVLGNGALWTWAATRYAVRGDLLKALRNE